MKILELYLFARKRGDEEMSLLDTIQKPADRSAIVTLCGDSGSGKSVLAATWPNPIFIRAEDGMQSIPAERRPDAFPMVKCLDDVRQQITTLGKEEHEYQTLVIDSVTALERIFIDEVMRNDPKQPKSINQALGGYGAGLSAVASYHQTVRKLCGALNQKRNMHIILIAHVDTEVIELPDEEPYHRYSLRLGKKSVAPYVDDSDLVGFLKLETHTKGDGDRKKAISDGTRIIVTYSTAANVSKNRFGITEDIVVEEGVNPFTKILPNMEA